MQPTSSNNQLTPCTSTNGTELGVAGTGGAPGHAGAVGHCGQLALASVQLTAPAGGHGGTSRHLAAHAAKRPSHAAGGSIWSIKCDGGAQRAAPKAAL